MSNYLKIFLRGSAISLLGAGCLGVANYLIRRILCNGMSLEDYGTFYSIFALFSLVFGFTDLGLTQSGTVMIASAADDHSRRDTVFSQLFFIKSVLAVLCAGGFVLYYLPRQAEVNLIFILLFLAYFVIQIIIGTLQALWGGQKKYSVQQAGYLAVALLILAALCISGNMKLEAVGFCYIFPVIIVLFGGLALSRYCNLGRLIFRIDKDVCRQLLTTGTVVAITTTLLSVMYYMDTIMLHSLRGAESAGLYNVALPIMQIVQACMVFPAVFLPIAVDMSKNKDYTNLLRFVRNALFLALAALVPVGIFFHYSSPWLIGFLFNRQYTAAANATTLLCLGLVFFTLGNFLFQIMLSLKKSATMAVIAAIATVCNLLLNYFMIKSHGVNGAATATLASYAIFSLLSYAALEYNLRKMKKYESEF